MGTRGLNIQKIVFIGAGSMAEAIIRGLKEQQVPAELYAMNRSNRAQLEHLEQAYGVHCAYEAAQKEQFVRDADVVVVAMKPKDVRQAFADFSGWLRADQLLVSVVAGLSTETLSLLVPEGMPVIRTMPNTSSTIGLGATGITGNRSATMAHVDAAAALFRTVGEVVVVSEDQMNMVNGISGSGPAYVYYFMEAMIAAGVAGGMDEATARDLTVQTFLGAASMVKQTGEAPAELRRKVTSPNGTTQAAIETFDRHGFAQAVAAGVNRCVERATEMGEQITKEVRGE